jgi:non-ribosomal peptide synthetase component F
MSQVSRFHDVKVSWSKEKMRTRRNAPVHEVPAKDQFQRPVTELVRARATANRQALAVADRSAPLTYGELDARANQVAHYLLSLGLEAEAPVGLCLGHSFDFVIAALTKRNSGTGSSLPDLGICA